MNSKFMPTITDVYVVCTTYENGYNCRNNKCVGNETFGGRVCVLSALVYFYFL